jgi:HTH-type transcriptional regulator/antitoxin HipB
VGDTGIGGVDLPGLVRRIRRLADLSQRELAERVDVSKSAIAAAESGRAGLDVRVLVRAAALARLRLALVDQEGVEVPGMSGETVRDMGNRHFPAHLDTRHGDEGWWHDEDSHHVRPRPWYTFDRRRDSRDTRRERVGLPADHQIPLPGDSPEDRAAARRRDRARARAEEHRRRFLAGEFRRADDGFDCSCPARCEELDDWSGRPVHADECPCLCDIA